ncbi:MAG: hypothetical protein KAU24_00645 [Candidatus Aenigmarchaeota archaeon]|nr:hypothetical protein [Candidatus Aenigmarchaeota archaeon]
MEQYVKDFVKAMGTTGSLFFDKQYLETGDITLPLKDGRRALYFINLGGFCDGESGTILSAAYARKIIKENLINDFDILYGPAYKGITIIDSTCNGLYKIFGINKQWAYRRKESKGHGEMGDFIGKKFFDGCRLLMADDVISSAATKFTEIDEVSAVAEKNKMDIGFTGLVIAADRQQKAVIDGKIDEGGRQIDISAAQYFTQKTDLPFHCISGVEEAIPHLYENKIEGPDGELVVTDKAMQEFEKYQKEFGVKPV